VHQILLIRNYPTEIGEAIDRILGKHYTLTGYHGDSGIEWVLEYRADKPNLLLELALSEYVIEETSLGALRIIQGNHWDIR